MSKIRRHCTKGVGMTSPIEETGEGFFDGLGGLEAFSRKTQAEWEAEQRARVTSSLTNINLFSAAMAAVKSGLSSIFGRVDGHDTELASLQSKTQKLEGVIGYANAYANGGFSLSLGSVKYSMSNQVGPIVGATMTNGAFVLGSKGLWAADGQATFNEYLIGAKEISLTLKVYAPDGSPHYKKSSIFDTSEHFTHSLHMPFTVPSAGYSVELWVNAAIGRGVIGGSEWNGLSVNKISTETS